MHFLAHKSSAQPVNLLLLFEVTVFKPDFIISTSSHACSSTSAPNTKLNASEVAPAPVPQARKETKKEEKEKEKATPHAVSSESTTRGGRFTLPDSESVEYKGALVSFAPSRSCKEEMLANEAVIRKRVPLLPTIVEDCEKIRKKTIMKRQSVIELVILFLLCGNLFKVSKYELTDDEVFAIILYSYDARTIGGQDTENLFYQLNEVLRTRVCLFVFLISNMVSKFVCFVFSFRD